MLNPVVNSSIVLNNPREVEDFLSCLGVKTTFKSNSKGQSSMIDIHNKCFGENDISDENEQIGKSLER